jgi:hypothetical protein
MREGKNMGSMATLKKPPPERMGGYLGAWACAMGPAVLVWKLP